MLAIIEVESLTKTLPTRELTAGLAGRLHSFFVDTVRWHDRIYDTVCEYRCWSVRTGFA
jgi:hypothetical protein